MHKPIVAGYRHTGIIVKDMKASLHFYRDILGLKVVQELADNSDYINTITGTKNCDARFYKMDCGDGTILEILEYRNYPTELIPQEIYNVGAAHIALRVHDAEDAYERLLKAGVKVLSKPVLSSEGIAKVFFCLDPNNVRVEMVEMLNMPK